LTKKSATKNYVIADSEIDNEICVPTNPEIGSVSLPIQKSTGKTVSLPMHKSTATVESFLALPFFFFFFLLSVYNYPLLCNNPAFQAQNNSKFFIYIYILDTHGARNRQT
jgi:hypothetical protein